jgi:hypothetical protein
MIHPGLTILILLAYALIDWALYEIWNWNRNGRYPPLTVARRWWNFYIRGRNYDGSKL